MKVCSMYLGVSEMELIDVEEIDCCYNNLESECVKVSCMLLVEVDV